MYRQLFILFVAAALLCNPAVFAEGGSVDAKNEGETVALMEPLDWQAFSEAASSIVEQYSWIAEEAEEDDVYRTGRLLVKTDGDLPDFSDYNPETVIRDDEGHYLIQFNSAKEARMCAEYLSAFQNVEYVEPDQVVSIERSDDN